ncbi:hypothetical protein FWF93_02990 [Candidatus Saccharibacteria bacterium]|nr:hypothetical protein [Candidatus Saccharibacteria bacterium]
MLLRYWCIESTKHADKRLRERFGKKINSQRAMQLAWDRGLHTWELKGGSLRRWVNGHLVENDDTYMIIFSNLLFLFAVDVHKLKMVLVTVIPVPSEHHKMVAVSFEQQRAKRKNYRENKTRSRVPQQ